MAVYKEEKTGTWRVIYRYTDWTGEKKQTQKAVKNYLNDLGEKSVSFTYEITGTQLGVYENKETILYWVKIVYGEGFTTVMGFVIQ